MVVLDMFPQRGGPGRNGPAGGQRGRAPCSGSGGAPAETAKRGGKLESSTIFDLVLSVLMLLVFSFSSFFLVVHGASMIEMADEGLSGGGAPRVRVVGSKAPRGVRWQQRRAGGP